MTGDDFNEDDVKWRWGELPEKTPDATNQKADKDKSKKSQSVKGKAYQQNMLLPLFPKKMCYLLR